VLDCACGTGELAVGLALRGCEVRASDASSGMVAQARGLAAAHGVTVDFAVTAWDALPPLGDRDATFCVGNSLVHAHGRAARQAALAAMAATLAPGGTLEVTSRNWEALRAAHPHLWVADRLVEREGVRALVMRAWEIPASWDDEHAMEVAVAVLRDDGGVEVHQERLTLWPFAHGELDEDLRAAGLDVVSDGWAPDADRYLVTARRPAA
jgi:SAM-dependent methyltransferase